MKMPDTTPPEPSKKSKKEKKAKKKAQAQPKAKKTPLDRFFKFLKSLLG
jgi:hypothetical protein